MKCEENGGCPFSNDDLYEIDSNTDKAIHAPYCTLRKDEEDCHLTPDSFPLIKAMIAGEWSCETCAHWCIGSCPAFDINGPVETAPCQAWQPKGEKR